MKIKVTKNHFLVFFLLIIIVVIGIAVVISGLNNRDLKVISSKNKSSSTSTDELSQCISPSFVLLEQGDNYKIYTDEFKTGISKYVIIDSLGKNIDYGFHDGSGRFSIKQDGDLIVMEYGLGGYSSCVRFYDIATGKVSRLFENPVAVSGDLVAYFDYEGDQVKLVVQNVFDFSKSHAIIEDETFSSAVFHEIPQLGSFNENNTKIEIEYLTEPEYEKIKKSFSVALVSD